MIPLPESPRLIYIPLKESHLDDILRINSDPEVIQYIKKGTRLSKAQELQALLNRLAYMNNNPGFGFWAVRAIGKSEIIGFVNLNHILEPGPEQGRAHLGYKIIRTHWGKGYGTEMCLALIEQAFQRAHLGLVNAYTDPENSASMRILEKCGFQQMDGITFVYDCPSIRFTLKKKSDHR